MDNTAVNVDRGRTALVVVDVQPDFMPGGPLGVTGADELVAPVSALLRSARFAHVVATQDWHPADHVSFASQHPGRQPFETVSLYGREQTLWPDHCIQGSAGAALHPGVDWDRVALILRKGGNRAVDSYSGFRHNWNAAGVRPPTGLAGALRELGVDSVVIVGIARDVCVKWTAEDAVAAGFSTTVIWDLTRPVDAGTDDAVRAGLEAAGVTIVGLGAFADAG